MDLYKIIRNSTDENSSMAIFRCILCTGILHLHCQLVKTHSDAICTGQRPNEKRKREERNKKTSKSGPVLHVSTTELNPCSMDHTLQSLVSRRRSLLDLVRVEELLHMTWQQWELVLPTLFGDYGDYRSYNQLHVMSYIDTQYITFSKMVVLTKFKCTSAVWVRCSAFACSLPYLLQPVVIRQWQRLVDAAWQGSCVWMSASGTVRSTI